MPADVTLSRSHSTPAPMSPAVALGKKPTRQAFSLQVYCKEGGVVGCFEADLSCLASFVGKLVYSCTRDLTLELARQSHAQITCGASRLGVAVYDVACVRVPNRATQCARSGVRGVYEATTWPWRTALRGLRAMIPPLPDEVISFH